MSEKPEQEAMAAPQQITDPVAAKEALVKIFSTMFTKNDLEADVYMLYHITPSLQVPFDIVRNHNRVKAVTSDVGLIKEVLALPTSKGVTILDGEGEDDDATCKLQIKLGQITLIIRDIPENTPEETVKNIFANIEGCPAPQSVKLDINNWFVTFDTEDDAKNALVYATKFNDKPVKARLKSETLPRVSAVRNSNRQMSMNADASEGDGNTGSSSSGAQGGAGNRYQPHMNAAMNMIGGGGNPNQGGPPGYGVPMPLMQNYYYQQGSPRGNPYMINAPMVMGPQGQMMQGQYGMLPYQGGLGGRGGGKGDGSGGWKGGKGRGGGRGQQQQLQEAHMMMQGMYPGGPLMMAGHQGQMMMMQPNQGGQPMMMQPMLVPTAPPLGNMGKQMMQQQMMYQQPQGQQYVNNQGAGINMMTPQQMQMFNQQQYNMQMKQQQGQSDGGEGRKKGDRKQVDGKVAGGKKGGKSKKSSAPNVFSQNDFPDTIGGGSNSTNGGVSLSGWANAAKGNNGLKKDEVGEQQQLDQHHQQLYVEEQHYAQAEAMQQQQQLLEKQFQEQQQQFLMRGQAAVMQQTGAMQVPVSAPQMVMQQQLPPQKVQIQQVPQIASQQQQFEAQNQLRAMLNQHPRRQGMAPQFPNHDSSDDIISFGSFDDSISLASAATLPVQVFASQAQTQTPVPVQSVSPVPHTDPSVMQMGPSNLINVSNNNVSGDGNVNGNDSSSGSSSSSSSSSNDAGSGGGTASSPPTTMWGTKKSFADIVGKR